MTQVRIIDSRKKGKPSYILVPHPSKDKYLMIDALPTGFKNSYISHVDVINRNFVDVFCLTENGAQKGRPGTGKAVVRYKSIDADVPKLWSYVENPSDDTGADVALLSHHICCQALEGAESPSRNGKAGKKAVLKR